MAVIFLIKHRKIVDSNAVVRNYPGACVYIFGSM